MSNRLLVTMRRSGSFVTLVTGGNLPPVHRSRRDEPPKKKGEEPKRGQVCAPCHGKTPISNIYGFSNESARGYW